MKNVVEKKCVQAIRIIAPGRELRYIDICKTRVSTVMFLVSSHSRVQEKKRLDCFWFIIIFSDESKYCISSRLKVLELGGRFIFHQFHSWFRVPCHLLVLVHLVLWGFRAPSLRRHSFYFATGPAHSAKATSLSTWLKDHVLHLPANSHDLNPT